MSTGEKGVRTVVVGGGVAGLGVARALRAAGADVTVLDSGEGGAASPAAGGMLSPLGEALGTGAFLELALESLHRWPAFAASLEAETGRSLGFRRCGKLLVARDDAGAASLRQRHAWLRAGGHDVRLHDAESANVLEGALGPVRSALLLPGEAVVDNRALVHALREALLAAGGRLVDASVASVELRGGRTAGVRLTSGEAVPADRVVVAAGAWSGRLAGLPRPVPVRPVRGQMLAYAPGRPLLARVVAGVGPDAAYLIPRFGDTRGRLVVGATEEEVGFRPETTGAGLDGLRRAAERLVPALARLRPVETWAGLRPGTPDDLPLLGSDPEAPGLAWACGHYRNGILLAPLTADLVAGAVLHDVPVPASVRPDRFGASGAATAG